jgi:hypothetical protein
VNIALCCSRRRSSVTAAAKCVACGLSRALHPSHLFNLPHNSHNHLPVHKCAEYQVTSSFANGTAMPSTHSSVQTMMASILGTWHPNVDAILRDPINNPMPTLHPPLDRFIGRSAANLPAFSIGYVPLSRHCKRGGREREQTVAARPYPS